MPPLRPQVYETGPTFGIGFGVSSRRSIGDPFWGAAAYNEPRVYTLYDDADNFYWDWPPQTTAEAAADVRARGEDVSGRVLVLQEKKCERQVVRSRQSGSCVFGDRKPPYCVRIVEAG